MWVAEFLEILAIDVCLLSNIMELDGIRFVVFKKSKKHLGKLSSNAYPEIMTQRF